MGEYFLCGGFRRHLRAKSRRFAVVALRNAPAGAVRVTSDFTHGGKVTKTPPGTRPMDYGSALLRLGP